MADRAFCPRCYEDVEFNTVEDTETIELDGAKYSYRIRKAICAACGAEAVYNPYRQEAGEAFDDAVREANRIVSLATVRDLPKKYNIGKRPLSTLLGWGELTYSRFIEGAIPNREYSDTIIDLYDHPESFKALLLRNGEKIKPIAKKKASEAVNLALQNQYPDAVRIYEVAERMIDLAGGDITAMALQKLVYYAQAFSAILCGAPLFLQPPRAWAAGPVYGQLWHEYKNGVLTSDAANRDDSPFSDDENDVIEGVYEAFGRYSGPELSKFTHSEEPWVEARQRAGAKEGDRCEEQIPLESIVAYFSSITEKYEIQSSDYIRRYADSLANKFS